VIRLSRLADYGIVMMTHMARHPDRQHTASEIAAESHLPLPTASKILKTLVRAGLLVSHRGVKGGYGLARPATALSVADVIVALEGPIALTACIENGPGECEIEALCPARANWQRINDAIRHALEDVSVEEMALAVPAAFALPLEVLADRPALPRREAPGVLMPGAGSVVPAHAK
jgi:FeS assembly SUF system regulator